MSLRALALAVAIGIALAAALVLWIGEPCVTDTECGCTDDCLEAQ